MSHIILKDVYLDYKVKKDMKFKDFKDKVAFALVSPFLVSSMIAISPVLFIESLIED